MRKLWLLVGLLVLSLPGLARANSYLDVFAVVHDPIMYTAACGGGAHHYSGDNLEAFAALGNVRVAGGELNRALNPNGSPRDPFLGSGGN